MTEETTVRPDPEITCWGTSTDLAGSEMERKKYYLRIQDGDKPELRIIVVRGPGTAISVEPYLVHEYDYDQYDDDQEESDDEYYTYVDYDDDEEEEE